MKKFLTLVAFLGFFGAVNAQTETAPVKEVAVEAVDAVKETATDAVDAVKEEAGTATDAVKGEAKETVKDEAKAPGCCAGKAKGAKCDHAKAEAGHGHGDGHGHAEAGHNHGEMKAHTCTEACKGEAHAYACGEEGHKCSADCHSKK